MSVDHIIKQIKSLKIQGATNIATAALKAYIGAENRKAAAKKLIAARPTEPMLRNVLKLAEYENTEKIMGKLASDQSKITSFGFNELKKYNSIYTHCHSSTVMKLIKSVKPEVVYTTETRPKYQGRISAEELASVGLKVIHSVDSAMTLPIEKCDAILLGADAINKKGFYNKVGSLAICKLAKLSGTPVYVCSHSLKVSKEKIEIEQRKPNEVWSNVPRGVEILNPAFDFVPKELVCAIICEKGVLSFDKLN